MGTMGTVEFVAILDAGADTPAERGGFDDWPDAVKVAKEHAERTQTRATVWARWHGRNEIMLEVDAGAPDGRLLRIFSPWSWLGWQKMTPAGQPKRLG